MYKFIVRSVLIGCINEHLPALEAGLLNGILWGDKTGFGKEFYQLLQKTGIVHIVVVSGSNVMLVAGTVIELLAYVVTRQRAIVIGCLLMWWYAVMVGLEPPVLRAGLLLTLFYGAQLVGRRFEVWRALGLVVLLMVAIDWTMLKGASFWLSMAAFVGVITNNQIPRNKQITNSKFQFIKQVEESFGQTIWISLWVTPILAMVFGKISIVGPALNVMVLGLVETISLIGIVGMVGWPVLWLAYPLLHYVVGLVEVVGKWPWAVAEVGFNWWMLAGWYLILIYLISKTDKAGYTGP